ncbi:hypothetical protein LTR08_004816 [Meristemomyces frigidus]|nr:hypothetical protein LTR08_004816 [Meristemomyces frigidus]
MAARTQTQTATLRAGASDSEDDLAAASANGTRKATKPKTTMTTAAATKPATKRKAAPKTARQPLKDRTNEGSDGEEEAEEVVKPKAKRARTTAATRKPRAVKETLGVIPETQPDPEQAEDVEASIEVPEDTMDVAKAPTPPQAPRFVQRARSTSVQPQPLLPRASARSVSAQPGFPPPRERSNSASGTERERRGADPELRRKLNELTKKYETLDLKYQNLQEIGRNNAETNFEKLKRASDQKTKDATDLIASLKKEIADLRKTGSSTTSETSTLQTQLVTLKTSHTTLLTDTTLIKEKLLLSQNEAKSLEAKLDAARKQLSAQDMHSLMKNPASATKNGALSRSVANTATDAVKEAKMKENLYSDLTGLIIRGVKRREGEDEYDCIQTGRNGSLHFHLSVANDLAPNSSSAQTPRTPSGLSYEEAEFAYEPFLDESRDRELLDLLPDYLTEEICFPRSHAVKFYGKVGDSMTKRVVLEEEGE